MKRLTDKHQSKLWEVAHQYKQMADVLSEIWWRAVIEGEPAKAKRYKTEMNDALNDAQEWAELAAESAPEAGPTSTVKREDPPTKWEDLKNT